jgi:hypothetical protein
MPPMPKWPVMPVIRKRLPLMAGNARVASGVPGRLTLGAWGWFRVRAAGTGGAELD